MGAMPPFVPTQKHRDKVKGFAAVGIPRDQMALALGISVHTLAKHFRAEIEQGAVEANTAVGSALFRNATVGNNVIAQIFWMKARAGWKDRVDINHNHSGTITVSHEDRLRQLAAEPDDEGRPMLEHDGPAEEMPDLDPVPKDREEAA